MVLITFRLSKATGTTASYVFGKELILDKLVFKGFTKEHSDSTADDAAGLAPLVACDVPIYLASSLFENDDRVLFYQGKNATIEGAGDPTGVGNFIPLGGARLNREMPFRPMNFTIINQRTVFAADDEVLFSLIQIHNNEPVALTSAQAFGEIVDDNSTSGDRIAIDHGINLYFEATTNAAHGTAEINIADAT